MDVEAHVDLEDEEDEEDEEEIVVEQNMGFIGGGVNEGKLTIVVCVCTHRFLDSDDEDDIDHANLLRQFETLPLPEEDWEIEMINRARERARVSAQRHIPSSSTGDSSETVLSMINDSNKRALEGGNLEAMRWSFEPVDKKMLLPLPEDKLWEISCEVSCLSAFFFSYANKFKTGRVGGVYHPLSLPSSTPWPHPRFQTLAASVVFFWK